MFPTSLFHRHFLSLSFAVIRVHFPFMSTIYHQMQNVLKLYSGAAATAAATATATATRWYRNGSNSNGGGKVFDCNNTKINKHFFLLLLLLMLLLLLLFNCL